MRQLSIVIGLFLAVAQLSIPAAHAAGDVTPSMAQETMRRISAMYFVSFPYLNQVLQQVSIKRATPDFLQQNGSSIGIYFRRTIFLNQDLIDAQGIQVDGAGFGIFLHEAWHAYFDLLMPQDRKSALESAWLRYYSTGGHSHDDSLVIGDEAIGNYLQSLGTVYGFAVKRYQHDGLLKPSMMAVYKTNYDGKDVYGYNSDGVATLLPISGPEKEAILREAGGAFPAPANLLSALSQRIGPIVIPAPAPTPPPLGH